MMQRNKEDAVSPVVGVMLMLVITVLLAGVFAAAAFGLFSGSIDKPANAELNYLTSTESDYIFEMTAGDPVAVSQLKVVFTLRDDKSVYAATEMGGNRTLRIGDLLSVQKPTDTGFSGVGKYIIWMFYDTKSGKRLSGGEIHS